MKTDTAPMLRAANIRCGYDGLEVLHGLDLVVRPGEKLCILGPNGCGKTTLLRALAGMLPTEGQVLISTPTGTLDVHRAPRPAVGRAVALMSQVTGVYFSYTVEETVMMGRYAHCQSIFGGVRDADRAAVRDALQRTGLWQLRDRSVMQLSGGQLQRVFLARTFAQSPHVILLDEPTNHLDLRYQLELVDYLRQWAAEADRCVVGVVHDINLALAFADTLLVLQNGDPVAYGPAADFDLTVLNRVYGLDVGAYMRDSLSRWQTG